MKVNLKKWLTCCIALVMLTMSAMMPVSASAHGGCHGSSHHSTTRYAVCTIKSCTKTYTHSHNGVTYCGHAKYAACTRSGCTKNCIHLHNGVAYAAHC